MCGICGIWGGGNSEAVSSMVAALHHRGPDDRGTYNDECVSLGMTRLAVIDTTAAGHQPLKNCDGSIWIVYNGEAYNFRSERKILESKGYTFESSSDTEVVLRMYEHYGDDFLLRIRGMFGLAVYDRRGGPGRERLLLARDVFGIKPLLYATVGGKLIFASELKALLASGLVKPEIDPEGLRLLLSFGSVYAPRTIIRGVAMLPPAHRMIVDHCGQRIERYWSLSVDRRPEFAKYSREEQTLAIADALEESVKLQLVSDVPLGAFLSGGIDSSLLVAMMARQVANKVRTFSVGFESEGAHMDETTGAETIARFIGTDHSKVVVTGTQVLDNIRNIVWSLDQPSADGVNSYFVSKAARSSVTVAISGNGGDELFAGYPSFMFMTLDQNRVRAPFESAARELVASIAKRRVFDRLVPGGNGEFVIKAREQTGFLNRYGNFTEVFGALGASRLISDELGLQARVFASLESDLACIDELPNGTTLQRVTALSLRGYNSNQLLRDTDAVSMSHSLEVRVPFLDTEVADAALALPDRAKLGETWDLAPGNQSYKETGAKRILLDVGRSLLPAGMDSQCKRGFEMPFKQWLNGSLNEVVMDSLSERRVKARGLLDVTEVAKVRDEIGDPNRSWVRPWLLMTLELWCQEVIDHRT
jgi:asparagine synthase (glutamine-hydrolysing)